MKRLDSFDAIYKELAPVGSNLKRIEREVDVNEKEYLSVLHGLNMAKLRQQSLEMSNNLSITDFPFLPLKPQPSKRIILVIMAFVATFILTMAILIGKALLGKTVQSTGRAEKFTGLKFLSAFPNYASVDKMVIVEDLNTSILSHFKSNFVVKHKEAFSKSKEPVIITISSIKKGEGKSYITQMLSEKFSDQNNSVLYLKYEDDSSETIPGITYKSYTHNDAFKNAKSSSEWLNSLGMDPSSYSIIFIELEELSKFSVPDTLLNGVTANLFVLSAERVWSESDSRTLNLFSNLTNVKPLILLNRADIDRLEAIIGEIPKRRSNARRVAKRVVTFDFQRT